MRPKATRSRSFRIACRGSRTRSTRTRTGVASPTRARHRQGQVQRSQEARRLQQEKRNIYDQIRGADELKQQQDLTQRLRSELGFFSVEEIDRKIKVRTRCCAHAALRSDHSPVMARPTPPVFSTGPPTLAQALEQMQQTSSLTIKEDKVMEEIKKLSTNKPMIKQYDIAQESLKQVKEHHNDLYTQLKAKNAGLQALGEVNDKHKGAMESAKAKDDAKRSDIPSLFKGWELRARSPSTAR